MMASGVRVRNRRMISMKTLVVEFLRGSSGRWRFRLKAGNGRILVWSENYSSYSKAVQGWDAILNAKKIRVKVIQ